MPRPDGVLYNFEKAALKPKAEPLPGKRKTGSRIKLGPTVAAPVSAAVEPGKPGRPSVPKKLSPQIIETILNKIEQGLPQESALVLAGISRQAVDVWRKRNPLLQLRFEQAECKFEERLLANINVFAGTDMKAAAWLLERRLPRWAPMTKTELTGKDGGPVLTLSQQLLASVAGGRDEGNRPRKTINVTPSAA